MGDLMGKALWKLVENAQRFPRRGGRVLCVHGAVSFHRARPCASPPPLWQSDARCGDTGLRHVAIAWLGRPVAPPRLRGDAALTVAYTAAVLPESRDRPIRAIGIEPPGRPIKTGAGWERFEWTAAPDPLVDYFGMRTAVDGWRAELAALEVEKWRAGGYMGLLSAYEKDPALGY